MSALPDRSDLERITAGTRRQYAEQSLLWTEPSTRNEDEYLQRIWNLANDVIVLEDALKDALQERDRVTAQTDKLQGRIDEIVGIAVGVGEGL